MRENSDVTTRIAGMGWFSASKLRAGFNQPIVRILFITLIIGLLVAPLGKAQAATITVNTTATGIVNDANCGLREAITAANTNAAFNGCPAGEAANTDTITLANGATYTLTIAENGANNDNLGGDLDFVNNAAAVDIILNVAGGGTATITQTATDSVMDVLSGASVQITGVTITGGSDPDDRNAGAGIYNAGTLALTNVTLVRNRANSGAGDDGGALYNAAASTLTITDSIIDSNSARDSGGALFVAGGTVTITNSRIRGNSASGTGGGAIFLNAGTLTINSTNINRSVAADGGSGTIDGGAIYVNGGTLNLGSNSQIRGSRVTDQGGAIFVSNTATAVSITNTVIQGNYARNTGAAIYNARNLAGAVSITGSCIMNNTATLTDTEMVNSVAAAQIATGNWWGDNAVGTGDVSGTWTTTGPLATAAAACSGAILEIRTISWDVVGMDANSPVNTGPERFPIGFRVCNIGYTAATDVQVAWTWDTTDPYIALQAGSASTISFGTLAVGTDPADGSYKDFNESNGASANSPLPANCADAYFNVDLLRDANSAAIDDRNARFHVTATSTNATTVSTPYGRQIYVENLVEQARNDVFCISGPTGTACPNTFAQQPQPPGQVVVVGNTYPFRMVGETAPGGYDQVIFMLDFPNNIFRVRSAVMDYTNPTALLTYDNNSQYADACGISFNPADAEYRTCDGPDNYGAGGQENDNTVGDSVTADYQVAILSAGTVLINGVIYDKSGASYHYNADFGALATQIRATAVDAPTNSLISLSKTVYGGWNTGASCPGVQELGNLVNGNQVTYCFVVTNTSTNNTNGGNVNLSNIVINDNTGLCSNLAPTIVPGQPTIVPPGGTTRYYCQGTYNGSGASITNTANASGVATVTDPNTCTFGTLANGFPFVSCPTPTSGNQINVMNPVTNTTYTVTSPNDTAVTTPVTLSYFSATRTGNATHFDWSTITETGNAGFNLYAENADGSLSKLNDELIESRVIDSISQTDYKLTLSGIDASVFFIEDVATNGDTEMHGPFSLDQAQGSREAAEAIDWAAIRAESDAKAAERAATNAANALRNSQAAQQTVSNPNADSALAGYPVFEVLVNQTGLHRLTYEQLLAAGFDLNKVMSKDIAMTYMGAPIAIRVEPSNAKFGPGSSIEFYGEALNTLYTGTNVYRLMVDKTLAVRNDSERANTNGAVSPYYMETATLNVQRAYGYTSPLGDAWYDTAMTGRAGGRTYNFTINVDGYVSGVLPARLVVNTYGVSTAVQNPDHHLVVRLNGVQVNDLRFDGAAAGIVNVELPAGVLKEGANTLTIFLPFDTGASIDSVRFDSASITYPRSYTARGNGLTFTAAAASFRVSNLNSADVRVVRIEGSKITTLTPSITASNGTYTATFAGTVNPAKYVVVSAPAMLTPTLVAARPSADLKGGQADFLIISHPDFISGLQPLVDARAAQGYSVRVVNVEDVYAQFNHGILDPSAIRSYISYAKANMGTEYVLLVGGDTYDYRNYISTAKSFIPTLYANTNALMYFTPADPLLADVDGDNVPDVALGRFPVRSSADLATMINKTLAYDAKPYDNTAVVASDVTFSGESSVINANLPQGWIGQTAHLDSQTLAAARANLFAAINNGVALTVFTGHSSTDRWTFSGMLSVADIAALKNAGRPTVVVQFGCWNAFYTTTSYDLLPQKFLLGGDKGAAAVLGATALADTRNEVAYGELLMPRLTQQGMTIGEAMRLAKADLKMTHPDALDMLLGYTLLGDPTLVVAP